MSQFYYAIAFLSMLFLLSSFLLLLYDRKKFAYFEKQIEEKKRELAEIVLEAEQMIEELNKLSDFVVATVEKKKEELFLALEEANKKEPAKPRKKREIMEMSALEKGRNGDREEEGSKTEYAAANPAAGEKAASANGKVIPANGRFKEVLMLSKKGLDETEIARHMNIGKGEVQLVLEMNRLSGDAAV